MLVECQSCERSEWVSHGRWLLAKSNDNTAFAVESGRYGAIGPRHGANLFIEVQTSYRAGLKKRKEHKEVCASYVKHATRDRFQKLKTHLGGVLPRGCPLMAQTRDDVGFSHAVRKVQVLYDQSQTSRYS